MTALAGSTLAATKPATSNVDNAIESFILISMSELQHSLSDLRSGQFARVMVERNWRLTGIQAVGLIQIKGGG